MVKNKRNDPSLWIEKDLQKLQEEELTKQLEVLFGSDEADRFMNPKLEEPSQGKFDKQDWNLHQQQQGAHVLWNNLRSNSRKKLARESKDLNNDYVTHRLVNWRSSSEHVERYKQRVELMHRIAHFNELKTKQLVQNVKLPSILDDSDSDSVKNIFADKLKEKSFKSIGDLRKYRTPTSSPELVYTPSSMTLSNSRITFLSEKDCESTGSFRKRMEKLGVESNIGISMPQVINHGELRKKQLCTRSEPVFHHNKSENDYKRRKSRSKAEDTNILELPRTQAWQPLTLNALSEYACSIPGPGSGEFKRGSVKLWKPSQISFENIKT